MLTIKNNECILKSSNNSGNNGNYNCSQYPITINELLLNGNYELTLSSTDMFLSSTTIQLNTESSNACAPGTVYDNTSQAVYHMQQVHFH